MITHRCDMRCRHCSYFGSSDERSESLSLDGALALLDRLAASGRARVEALQILGGEPLLWPDLPVFLRAAHGAGFTLEVVTNGTSVNDAFLEVVADGVLDGVCVSIDGMDAATYGVLRDARRFPRVMENLERLAKARPAGTRLRVNYVLARGNDVDPEAIVQFHADHGADLLSFVPMGASGQGAVNREALELSPARLLDFAEQFHGALDRYVIPANLTLQPLVEDYLARAFGRTAPRVFNGCPAMTQEWALTSDGVLDPCPVILGRPAVRAALAARPFSLRDETLDAVMADPSVAATRAIKGRVSYADYEPCVRCPFLGNWCDPCFVDALEGRPALFPLCLEAERRGALLS
jgi:MoaA/NifB/PqqE/SkfB family radical SAM enzyme